jgi:hypothetical protein
MTASNPAWQLFAALQREPDPQSIDRSLGREEALDVVLDEVVKGPATDTNSVRKRFYSLCRNRLSKQNHRRAVDRRRFRSSYRSGGSDSGTVLLTAPARNVLNQIAYDQLISLIRTVLPEDEFGLLLDLAEGYSYADLALDRGTTVSSLKSKAFRVREKIRKSGICGTLRHGLRC